MTNFKVGDKVKYVGGCTGWGGRVATVTEANRIAELGGAFDYLIADAQSDLLVSARELELVKPEPKFKVGDIVTFAEPKNDHWQGGKAEVVEGNGKTWGRFTARVRVIEGPPKNTMYFGGETLNFDPAHLNLWKAPTKFKVGEWVEITGWGSTLNGTKLQVRAEPSSSSPYYRFEGQDNSYGFTDRYLKAAEAPKSFPTIMLSSGGFETTAFKDVYITDTKPVDNVNDPSHYGGKDNPYEVIKVAEAWGLDKDAYLFNVLKYIARAGKKGKKGSKVEDLKKGGYYMNRRITQEEAKK